MRKQVEESAAAGRGCGGRLSAGRQARDGVASAARGGSRVGVAGMGDHGGAGLALAGATECIGLHAAKCGNHFIHMLKEHVLWVRSFETLEELRQALLAFTRTYNAQWMLETYDYRRPAQARRDLVGLDAAA